MSKLTQYLPNSVKLPDDLKQKYQQPLQKPLRENLKHMKPPENVDFALLHDVFRSPCGTKILFIDTWSGRPDFSEMAKVMPLTIFYNGKKLHYDAVFSSGEHYIVVFQIRLSAEMQGLENINLTLKWQLFDIQITVPKNPFADAKKVDFTISTAQRNNHTLWISDWCKYYHREHQVKRIVLYDNCSDDFAAVEKALKNIPDEVEIILINHNFYRNLFNNSQLASLNHCPLLLGDKSQFYLNFDIDEYLVVEGKNNLFQCLEKLPKIATFMVGQHSVPNYYQEGFVSTKIPRANDFVYKIIGIKTRRWPKTINRYGEFDFVDPHSTIAKIRIKSVFIILWLRRTQKVLRICNFGFIAEQIGHIIYRTIWHPNMHFKHYKALNTGWKHYRPVLTCINDNWVLDNTMVKKFKQHKIIEN